MPKRRRNPDGSLVTPLSPRQLENLAKGRAAIAAKYAGAGQGDESADEGERARQGEKARGQGQQRSSSVEVVRLAKDSGGRAKASGKGGAKKGSRSRGSSTRSAATRGASSAKESRGFWDRIADSLRET